MMPVVIKVEDPYFSHTCDNNTLGDGIIIQSPQKQPHDSENTKTHSQTQSAHNIV